MRLPMPIGYGGQGLRNLKSFLSLPSQIIFADKLNLRSLPSTPFFTKSIERREHGD
jgi:hypothetical protein